MLNLYVLCYVGELQMLPVTWYIVAKQGVYSSIEWPQKVISQPIIHVRNQSTIACDKTQQM